MSTSAALDVARNQFLLGLFDRPDDPPSCLVVDLEEGSDLGALNDLAPTLPCVTIGVAGVALGRAPTGFDVLLARPVGPPRPWVSCSEAATEELVAGVQASPRAAIALVQLLRLGERLSVRDAVVAESFVYSMLQAGPTFSAWLAGRPRREPVGGPVPVVVTREGTHLEIVLNRPSVHNALNAAMRDGLIDALKVAAVDASIETVRISGAGPSFCSGGDLGEFGTAQDPATAHAVRVGRSVGLALEACADRVTVDLHGSCVGAGIEIPGFARRLRATPDATISLPEVAFGLVPGAGGTASLPRRVGRHRTAFLALSGTVLDAPTALEWGLVDEIL